MKHSKIYFEESEQASEPDSVMTEILKLPDQEFKTTIIMLRGRQYIRKDGQC